MSDVKKFIQTNPKINPLKSVYAIVILNPFIHSTQLCIINKKETRKLRRSDL